MREIYAILLCGCCYWTVQGAEPIASPPNNFIEAVRRCGQRELDLSGVLLVRSDDGQTELESPLDVRGLAEILQSLAKQAEWEHLLNKGAQPPGAGVSRLSIRLRVTPKGASYHRVNNGGFSSPAGEPTTQLAAPLEAPGLPGRARNPAQDAGAAHEPAPAVPDAPPIAPVAPAPEPPKVDDGSGFHFSGASIAWTLEWQAEGQVWRANGTGDVQPEYSLTTHRRQPELAPWGAALARSELPLVLARSLWDVRGESAALDALLMIAPTSAGGLFEVSAEFEDFTFRNEPSEFAAAWNRLRFLAVNTVLPRLQVPDDLARSRAIWHLERLYWNAPHDSEEGILRVCHREASDGRSTRYLMEVTHRYGSRCIVPFGVVLKTSSNAARRRVAAEQLISLNTGESWDQVREAAKAGVAEANQVLSEHALDWLMSPPFLILLGVAVLLVFGIAVALQLRNQ